MVSIADAFEVARRDFREFAKVAETVEGIMSAHTRAILYRFSDRIDRIESRTKTFVSIRDNYISDYGLPVPGLTMAEFLRDANDLVGVRVVVYYNSDVDAIRDALMEAHPGASLDEKLTIHDLSKGSRFGYRAVHINFTFSDEAILKYQARSAVGVELQIRTILSDAWARHSHKLAYKAKAAPTDELVRSFALTAAMLENVDAQIEGLRSLPIVSGRRQVSEELSWMHFYEGVVGLLGTPLDEDTVKALYVTLAQGEDSSPDREDEFLRDAERAWTSFGDIDFARYGIRDPLTQLKVALYGLRKDKYENLIALYMREKIDTILQVGGRRELQKA
jgi:ppGpp synthetase/RelA/SpoT-type nucleotidyltranferase